MKVTVEADGITIVNVMSPEQETIISDFIEFCDGKVTAADILSVAVEVGVEMYQKAMKKSPGAATPRGKDKNVMKSLLL